MKILLVDDDADDRALLQEAIKMIDQNIGCDFAQDGQDALIKLSDASEPPDLIFLDVNMPRLDGRECLREIKANDLLKDIPVVICSTSDDQNEIQRFLQMGASYITKPNCFNKLLESVEKFIITLKHSRRLTLCQA